MIYPIVLSNALAPQLVALNLIFLVLKFHLERSRLEVVPYFLRDCVLRVLELANFVRLISASKGQFLCSDAQMTHCPRWVQAKVGFEDGG